MIRIQYDVFVSDYYDFDEFTGVDTGDFDNGVDDDDVNPIMI